MGKTKCQLLGHTANVLHVDNTDYICVKNPPTTACDYCKNIFVLQGENAETAEIICKKS